jgi:hypothetical protein
VTPDKLQAFRIKLTNELWKSFPRADAASIWKAANVLLPLIMRESFNLVDMPHEADCVCWNCVMALHSDAARRLAEWRTAQEAADEHD